MLLSTAGRTAVKPAAMERLVYQRTTFYFVAAARHQLDRQQQAIYTPAIRHHANIRHLSAIYRCPTKHRVVKLVRT